MKEGWTYKKLGEVCNIDFGTRVVKSRDAGSIYPVYGGGGATFKMDTFNRENCMVISRFGMSEQCTRFVKGKFFLNDSGLTLSMKTPCMNQTFLDWQILSLNNKIYSLGRGAAQKNLDTKALGDLVISYPKSLSVQDGVVERLDSAFENIDKLKANAEKQLSEARILFQKSLAKAMEPKEGWEEKKLKDIAQVRIGPFGSLLHKKDYISGGIPLVNPIHMVNGNIVANNDYTISDVKAKELSNYLLKENDIVFARRGEVGRCAIVTGEDEGFLCGTGSLFVRFLREIDSNFMLMLFQSDYCKNYLEHNASGATMLNINAGIVEDMPLTLPPLAEQQRIVERLDSLSENVRKYEEIQRQIISECDALKQALLRKVFE